MTRLSAGFCEDTKTHRSRAPPWDPERVKFPTLSHQMSWSYMTSPISPLIHVSEPGGRRRGGAPWDTPQPESFHLCFKCLHVGRLRELRSFQAGRDVSVRRSLIEAFIQCSRVHAGTHLRASVRDNFTVIADQGQADAANQYHSVDLFVLDTSTHEAL
ncbi:hypothetical protein BV20DRAFT_962208 [Pilatotrama ljubarskyi]|nr:hypothetical protein BV20DRAFT_962208 [Pilatotrama ljubarskyi]